jgi:pilus assembly protein CpaD
MTAPRPFRLSAGFAVLAAGSALLLGGCDADGLGPEPQTYTQRHPIVLSEGAERLDLPVGAGPRGLTERQKVDIRAFAANWRQNGRGPIGIVTPAAGPSARAAKYAAPEIRHTLASAGVPATAIIVSRYRSEEGGVAPVKLGFVKLKAQVPHPCGAWPEDLGYGGDFYGSTQNRDYWNFGCATQQNLAAQVADPEDLARPHAESPVYAARRQKVIESYREGTDTAVQIENSAKISSVGGN